LRARKLADRLQGNVAKAAARLVDDALENEIVVGLCDEAQIGVRVADFGALIETRAADDAIGNAEIDEAVFEFAHLERGAYEDRDFVEHVPLALQLLDFLGDVARFLLAVPIARYLDLLALVGIRPERLAEARLIGGDEARGRAQNLRRGAIVPFEADHLRARKVLLEAQDVV